MSDYLLSENGVARYVDPSCDGDCHHLQHLPVTRDYPVSPAEDCGYKVTISGWEDYNVSFNYIKWSRRVGDYFILSGSPDFC